MKRGQGGEAWRYDPGYRQLPPEKYTRLASARVEVRWGSTPIRCLDKMRGLIGEQSIGN